MPGAGHDTGTIFRNCTDFVTAKTPRARRHTKTFLFGFFALLASLRLQSCVGQPLRVQSECHPDRGPEGSERRDLRVSLRKTKTPLSADPSTRYARSGWQRTCHPRGEATRRREGRQKQPNNQPLRRLWVFAFPKATRQAISRRQGWLTTLAAGPEDEVTTGWPRQPCRNFVLSEGAKRPSRRICAGRGKEYG